MSDRSGKSPVNRASGNVTLVSYNRPLTRSAHRALKPFGIVDTEAVNDWGRWTLIEMEETPDEDVLYEHELRVDE